jgi:hypothetical protein
MIAAKQSDKQNKYNRLVRDKKKSLAQKKERNYSHLVDFKRQTDRQCRDGGREGELCC